MSGLFNWSMRYGAAILFVISLGVLVVSFVTYVTGMPNMFLDTAAPEKTQPMARLWVFASGTANALHSAAFPFFGALVIERLDRWRGARA